MTYDIHYLKEDWIVVALSRRGLFCYTIFRGTSLECLDLLNEILGPVRSGEQVLY